MLAEGVSLTPSARCSGTRAARAAGATRTTPRVAAGRCRDASESEQTANFFPVAPTANGPRRSRFHRWRRGPESNRPTRICNRQSAWSEAHDARGGCRAWTAAAPETTRRPTSSPPAPGRESSAGSMCGDRTGSAPHTHHHGNHQSSRIMPAPLSLLPQPGQPIRQPVRGSAVDAAPHWPAALRQPQRRVKPAAAARLRRPAQVPTRVPRVIAQPGLLRPSGERLSSAVNRGKNSGAQLILTCSFVVAHLVISGEYGPWLRCRSQAAAGGLSPHVHIKKAAKSSSGSKRECRDRPSRGNAWLFCFMTQPR